jgi:hypothetical protein
MSSGDKEELGQELGQEPKLEEPKLPPPFKIQKRYEKYNQHFLNIQNAMKEIEHELDELHKEIDGISPEPMDLHETVAPNQVETSIPEPSALEVVPSASESEPGALVVPGDLEVVPGDLEVVPSDLEVVPSDLEVVPSDLEVVPSDSESETSDSESSDIESESPYTKKYSSKLQYPTTELALKVEDYIESNPEIHDFTLVYCCYSINTDYMIPFVVYSGKESDGKYQFPSVPITITEDTDIESYKNTIKDGMFTGYIPDATNPSVIYMFYSVLTPKLLPGKEATINELCHLKTVDGIGIHESIDKLFTQNTDLLYINDLETSEHIPVPFSGYLCTMDDANHITNVVKEEEEEDIQLFTTDIFNVGLQDDFYYLTTKSLNPGALRYVIFPLKAVNFDKSIMDYSEYNSVYYNSPEMEFWAVTSIKQIGKI